MIKKINIFFALFFIMSFVMAGSSWAVPSFSRATKEACSYCHSNWPLLNSYGKQFLASGFKKISKGQEISDDLKLSENIVSGRLNFRLIDKTISKDTTNGTLTNSQKQLKIRGLHEGEIMLAGSMDDIHFFVEFESEDEWSGKTTADDTITGFQVQMTTGYVGYKIHPLASIRAGYMSPFGTDGSNTVYRGKPARYQWSASGKGFTPGVSQAISLYGEISGLSYILAYHGVDTDGADVTGRIEGKDPKDKSIRLAYGVTGCSVGGFYSDGKNSYSAAGDTKGTTIDSKKRLGIDFQYDGFSGLQINGLYAQKDVENSNVTAKDSNLSLFVQYYATDDLAVGVNYDSYTESDGDDKWSKGAIFFTKFIKENFKAQLGWEGTLSNPDRFEKKGSRVTFVMDLGI